jgi:hypothetical protein
MSILNPKYEEEETRSIPLSENTLRRQQSKLKNVTRKVMHKPHTNQFDHTHYCLNCRDWYQAKKSISECKLTRATITHNEHLISCMTLT